MATEPLNSATSEELAEVDWIKNSKICGIVVHDLSQVKDVVKAIKERLCSENPNAQLYTVTLLEMLMNVIGDPVHKQVIDAEVLPILVDMMKKKDLRVQEKTFRLFDTTQQSVGGSAGKFPEYYCAYEYLVKVVKFPQGSREAPSNNPNPNLNHQTSQSNKIATLNVELAASRKAVVAQKPEPQTVFGTSMVEGRKAQTTFVLEALSSWADDSNVPGRNLQKSELGGVIFTCTNYTILDCLMKRQIG